MTVAVMAMIGLAVLGALAIFACFSGGLEQKTCRDCGSGPPALQALGQTEPLACGDWACPQCGTRFNPHGRARNPLG